MNSGKQALEEGADEFQELKEEVLTYTLAEPIATEPQGKFPSFPKSKNSERHKLQLLPQDHPQILKEFDFKLASKSLKKIQATLGRIISVGSVTFKSNFQCGNILDARLTAPNTFEIELEQESNSNRTSGWFYFSVEGIRGEGHFVIKGFTKSSSLYNEGMKICYREAKELTKWRRGGSRISYANSTEDEDSYELRFSHFFKNNQHTCIEFAYCFPYGLKKLYSMINHIKSQVTCQSLAKSFNGLEIPLLTIGNKESSEVIILSARVHPGETVSSFIMQGFLKELASDNESARMLRAKYLFKIVPMLNPDGVTKGNYRFSGYGCDLNRKWKSCKENQQPQIYHMKELIKSMNKDRKVVMYIDMHGHSRKKNVFFYGCCEKDENGIVNTKAKEFPFLMEKLHDAFRYENCCFNVQKDKDGTARVTVWKELKIDYVYTLESSFCGPEFGVNYLENDYQKIGKKLCEGIALFFYSNKEEETTHQYKSIEKLNALKQKAFSELMDNSALLHVGDDDDSGSESEPETGEISDKDRNPQTGLPRTEAVHKDAKGNSKTKKMFIHKQFYSQSSINQQKLQKLKRERQFDDMNSTRKSEKLDPRKQQFSNNSMLIVDTSQFDKMEVKIANTINTFELQSLRASALYQKNVRVHSFTRNKEGLTSKSKRAVNSFSEEVKQEKERLKFNLMHSREGAQYRRVRKMAEQSQKKELLLISEEENKVVKQLRGNEFYMSSSQRTKNSTIAPRFYPISQHRNRRTSMEGCFKRLAKEDELKKISINGDEIRRGLRAKQAN